jgi:hypothetical protein
MFDPLEVYPPLEGGQVLARLWRVGRSMLNYNFLNSFHTLPFEQPNVVLKPYLVVLRIFFSTLNPLSISILITFSNS